MSSCSLYAKIASDHAQAAFIAANTRTWANSSKFLPCQPSLLCNVLAALSGVAPSTFAVPGIKLRGADRSGGGNLPDGVRSPGECHHSFRVQSTGAGFSPDLCANTERQWERLICGHHLGPHAGGDKGQILTMQARCHGYRRRCRVRKAGPRTAGHRPPGRVPRTSHAA